MNDFITIESTALISKKTYQIKSDGTNKPLNAVAKKIDEDFPAEPGKKYNVVYCYSLASEKFKYPNGKSNVLYIGYSTGERKGSKQSLSYRFVHCKEGRDAKSNMCLRYFYKNQVPLILEIYDLSVGRLAKAEETILRQDFLKKYAALPIADGASYNKEK